MKSVKNWMMGSVLAAVGMFATVAKANTAVQYYTANATLTAGALYNSTFASNTALGGSSVTYTSAAGNTLQLSFTTFTSPVLSIPDNIISTGHKMGDLTLTETGFAHPDSATVNNLKLTFDLFQNIPGPANNNLGQFIGTVTVTGLTISTSIFPGLGTVTIGSANSSVTFSGSSVDSNTSPDILYFLDPVTYNIQELFGDGGPNVGSAEITADILTSGGGGPNGAPLPSVASMGMTLMGLMVCGLAGRKLVRRSSIA